MNTDNNSKSFSRTSLLNFDSFYDDTKYEWYAAKHRKPSPAELSLVNGLSIECCPHCGGTHFKKSGYYSNGTRRYRCLDCGRVFSPLTGTMFDAHKILVSEWIEYMIHLFEFHSFPVQPETTETRKRRENTGFPRSLSFLLTARRISFCQVGSIWTRHISRSCQKIRRKSQTENITEGFPGAKSVS